MADEAVEKYLPQAMQGIESKVQRVIDSKINEATRELIQKKVNDAVAAAAAVLKG
jgi:phage baseplate assembly protein W